MQNEWPHRVVTSGALSSQHTGHAAEAIDARVTSETASLARAAAEGETVAVAQGKK
jgi:hypothetical protein